MRLLQALLGLFALQVCSVAIDVPAGDQAFPTVKVQQDSTPASVVTFARVVKSIRTMHAKAAQANVKFKRVKAVLRAVEQVASTEAGCHESCGKCTGGEPEDCLTCADGGRVTPVSEDGAGTCAPHNGQVMPQSSNLTNQTVTLPPKTEAPTHRNLTGPVRNKTQPGDNSTSRLTEPPTYQCYKEDCGNPRSDEETGCFCDHSCREYGDCCQGYSEVCLGIGVVPSPSPLPSPDACLDQVTQFMVRMLTEQFEVEVTTPSGEVKVEKRAVCWDIIEYLVAADDDLSPDHLCYNKCWDTFIWELKVLNQVGCSELEPEVQLEPLCVDHGCTSQQGADCIHKWIEADCKDEMPQAFLDRCEEYGYCAMDVYAKGLCPAVAYEQRGERRRDEDQAAGEAMCEGHNYDEAQCLGVGGGCCDYEDGRCWWGGSVCEERPRQQPALAEEIVKDLPGCGHQPPMQCPDGCPTDESYSGIVYLGPDPGWCVYCGPNGHTHLYAHNLHLITEVAPDARICTVIPEEEFEIVAGTEPNAAPGVCGSGRRCEEAVTLWGCDALYVDGVRGGVCVPDLPGYDENSTLADFCPDECPKRVSNATLNHTVWASVSPAPTPPPTALPKVAACAHLNNCSGHGHCFRGKCVCDPGYGKTSEGGKENCSQLVIHLCPDSCFGHGACVPAPNSDEMVCQCFPGYSGDSCDEWTGCRTQDFCSGQGMCKHGHGHGLGAPVTCKCRPGYWGSKCENRMDSCFDNCSGHGQCTVVQYGPLTGKRECECDAGFSGRGCVNSTGTHTCPNMCSGNGVCYDDSGGNGTSWLCDCRDGFTGEDCSTVVNLCPGGCGHGYCRGGRCVCEAPFIGAQCNVYNASNDKECADLDFCSGRGVCAAPLGGSKTCHCFEGFDGEKCHVFDSEGQCPNDCSGHGRCKLVPEIKCMCDELWTGVACNESLCDTGAFGVCSTHGVCQKNEANHKYGCACDPLWRHGNDSVCELPVCPGNCNGNGMCLPDHSCLCVDGWAGPECGYRSPLRDQTLSSEADRQNRVAAQHEAEVAQQEEAEREAALVAMDHQGVTVYLYDANSNCNSTPGLKRVPESKCIKWNGMSFRGTCNRDLYGDMGGNMYAFASPNCSGTAAYSTFTHQVMAGDCVTNFLDRADLKFLCGDRTEGLSDDVEIADLIQAQPGCLNDCGGQGKCVNGMCQCTDGFTGADCSIEPPGVEDEEEDDGLGSLGMLLELDEGKSKRGDEMAQIFD